MSSPIQVTGADRSGTTLMFALLASHPDVAMIRRANLWRWFDEGFGDLARPENLEACLDALARYARLEVLEPDFDRIRREFERGEPRYGRLFSLLFEHHAEKVGARRWGDKSLHTEHHIDRLLAEWPDAKLVQMVRDPRDRHASVSRRYEDTDRGVSSVTGRWLASVRAIRRNVDVHPANAMMVRYEDLALRPDEVLAEVCDFVEVEYDPTMLAMGAVSAQAEQGGNSSFERSRPGTISTASIGRFRTVLDPLEVALVEALVGDDMTDFGYEPSGIGPQGWGALRMRLFDLPAVRVKMHSWMLRDARHRRSGPSVPPRRLSSVAG